MKTITHTKIKMDPLYILAENKNLPEFQFMDMATLDWIKTNGHQIGLEITSDDELPVSINLLEKIKKFLPARKWFCNEKLADSMHGIRHLIRVLVLSALFIDSTGENKQDKITNSILVAASLHDIRRMHDKEDKKHAQNAMLWAQQNISEILTAFSITENDIIETLIFDIIALHDTSSSQTIELRNSWALSVLQIADCLDRFRQPKLKWWPNFNFLKLTPTREMQTFAFNLVVKSEEKYLRGLTSEESVMSSLKNNHAK